MADTEPTPDDPQETDEPQEPESDPQPPNGDDDTDWKSRSRQHERDAKKLRKELDALRKENQTDQDRAIEAARAEGRSEALAEAGSLLVDAEVRAAAAGRLDVDALLDGLDRSRFLGDDGKPDREAIADWVGRIAPTAPDTPPAPKVPAGPRGEAKPDQLTRADLKTMSPKEIEEARKAGRLTALLGGND